MFRNRTADSIIFYVAPQKKLQVVERHVDRRYVKNLKKNLKNTGFIDSSQDISFIEELINIDETDEAIKSVWIEKYEEDSIKISDTIKSQINECANPRNDYNKAITDRDALMQNINAFTDRGDGSLFTNSSVELLLLKPENEQVITVCDTTINLCKNDLNSRYDNAIQAVRVDDIPHTIVPGPGTSSSGDKEMIPLVFAQRAYREGIESNLNNQQKGTIQVFIESLNFSLLYQRSRFFLC